jgi:hypothetical protein
LKKKKWQGRKRLGVERSVEKIKEWTSKGRGRWDFCAEGYGRAGRRSRGYVAIDG